MINSGPPTLRGPWLSLTSTFSFVFDGPVLQQPTIINGFRFETSILRPRLRSAVLEAKTKATK